MLAWQSIVIVQSLLNLLQLLVHELFLLQYFPEFFNLVLEVDQIKAAIIISIDFDAVLIANLHILRRVEFVLDLGVVLRLSDLDLFLSDTELKLSVLSLDKLQLVRLHLQLLPFLLDL